MIVLASSGQIGSCLAYRSVEIKILPAGLLCGKGYGSEGGIQYIPSAICLVVTHIVAKSRLRTFEEFRGVKRDRSGKSARACLFSERLNRGGVNFVQCLLYMFRCRIPSVKYGISRDICIIIQCLYRGSCGDPYASFPFVARRNHIPGVC